MKNSFTETYDFLVSIIGNAPYGIVSIDLDGCITMCNKMALHHLNIKSKTQHIVEKEISTYIQHIPKLNRKIQNCLEKSRKPFDFQNITVEDYILNIRGRKILNGMIITTSDITEAKEMEHKMMNAILEGEEKERRRLAKEIHDGIGPLMSTIKLNLESVKKDMDDASDKTLTKIANMEDLIHNVASDIRDISHALVPSALRDFGLIAALENLVLKANQAESIHIEFFNTGMDNRLDNNAELGLYRIAQELLNNAFKYAKAKNITIQIVKSEKQITLTVEDDGVGFEKEKIQNLIDTGIGLRNIKTRILALNGVFHIDTSPNRGVITTIEIPLNI